jgi:nicotinate-nucleotide adenylyltransferase
VNRPYVMPIQASSPQPPSHLREGGEPVAIGIFGGTFDPIHLGHVHVALSAYHGLHLRQVSLIPSAQPLLRSQPMASADQRLQMVKLAVSGHLGLNVDDREIKRGGPSYMVDMLGVIRAEVGNTPLCCILGMDQFIQFDQWKDWREILELAHLVVTTRAGQELALNTELKNLLKQRQVTDSYLLHEQSAGLIFLQEIIPVWISGTHIRAEIRAGRTPEAYLAPKVWGYIHHNQLYRPWQA